MTEIIFTFRHVGASAYYEWRTDHVVVCLRYYANRIVSDEELIEHINWQIEHEVMHKVLHEYIDPHTSKLLDSESFRLYERINPESFNRTLKINSKLGWNVRVDDF